MAAAKRVLRYLCSTSGLGCEAEIYAGAMAAQELHWLTYLLTDLGEQPRSPPVLYVDNKAMLALCREHRLEHRTKHIALRYFLARELQQRGQLRLAYVASQANTADIFTRALAPSDHQRFCTMLGFPTCTQLFASSFIPVSSHAAHHPNRPSSLPPEQPSRPTTQQPSRPAAQQSSSRAALPPSRPAAEPPSSRATLPPSRPAAEQPSRRAAESPSRPPFEQPCLVSTAPLSLHCPLPTVCAASLLLSWLPLCDRADGLSLFDLTSGASPAPTADADATVRSEWATRDAAARLAVCRHLPPSE
ncbi:unnamed protein product, partial [Closterium sp. NIES-54]